CLRPRSSRVRTRSWASSPVIRPRETASWTTSSMRSRVNITRLSGATIPRVMASRTSAALRPLPPAAEDARRTGFDAADPVLRARFCAVCWRPRAFPPLLAAVFRADDLVRAELEERDELFELVDRERLDDDRPDEDFVLF